MGDECVSKIRVVPNSKRDWVVGLMDGKTNVALVKLLAPPLPLEHRAIESLGG